MKYRKEFVFASSNSGKLQEVRRVAARFGWKVFAPAEVREHSEWLRCAGAEIPDPEETADSYVENARIKARAYAEWCTLNVLADDSGLEVEALQGAPGVCSARFAGPQADSAANRKKLLSELAGVAQRDALFRSVLVFCGVDDREIVVTGTVSGCITVEPAGSAGFGYDSLFEVAGQGKTMAELKEQSDDVVTHRVVALEKLFHLLADS